MKAFSVVVACFFLATSADAFFLSSPFLQDRATGSNHVPHDHHEVGDMPVGYSPQMQMNWTMYSATDFYPLPPYANEPPAPYTAARGTTYYDFKKLSMVEIYHDWCIPIFPNGNDWKCIFLNTHNTTWLINDSPDMGPCCVFGKPWLPPKPGKCFQ